VRRRQVFPAASNASRDDNAAVVVAAILVTAACWAATVYGGRLMAGTMPMPGGWSMSMAWMAMPGQSALGAAAMFLAMWEVMMIAMMLPSAMPMVLLHRHIRLTRRAQGAVVAPEGVLLAGYFTIWLLFGALAYGLGIAVVGAATRHQAVSRAIPPATGLALVLAGLYQCTPWKRVCLAHCRTPLSFLLAGWREGIAGTFTLGVQHGAYCAACCWALMAMQLVVGVMNLPAMGVVAGVIFVEKVWRRGEQLATVVGVIAVATGAALLLAPLVGGR